MANLAKGTNGGQFTSLTGLDTNKDYFSTELVNSSKAQWYLVIPTTLKAYREGVGGGGDMLYLREDSTFIDRYVMFGIDEQKGRYRIANDTIFFNSDEIKLDYGLIDSVSIRCHLKGHPQGKEVFIYKIIKE